MPDPAAAQMAGGGGDGGGAGTYALEEGERNLKFAAIPIPGYSDVLGFIPLLDGLQKAERQGLPVLDGLSGAEIGQFVTLLERIIHETSS